MLASFTDVLLLPVTIVPRTTVAVGKAFGAALTTGGNAAVQGIAMLNPQRWGATNTNNNNVHEGYMDFNNGGDAMLFDVGADDDEEDEKGVNGRNKEDDTKRCRSFPSFASHYLH